MAKTNNLAFDYSAYDEEVSVDRKIKHKANPDSRKKTNRALTYLLVIVSVALLCSMIYGKVEISSLYTNQSNLQDQLAEITNENISLESELSQKTGLTKVEEYAEDKLGLQKLEKSQIEYVEVDKEVVAEVVAPEETNVFVKIKRWFTDVLEYMGA